MHCWRRSWVRAHIGRDMHEWLCKETFMARSHTIEWFCPGTKPAPSPIATSSSHRIAPNDIQMLCVKLWLKRPMRSK